MLLRHALTLTGAGAAIELLAAAHWRFAVTRAGALALANTQAMRDRLWEGVDLRGLLTGSRAK